jgi:hypothetical protein
MAKTFISTDLITELVAGYSHSANIAAMWGNTLGWMISIVLLAGMIFGLRAIDTLQQISPPTEFGKNPTTLAKIHLPISPSTVVAMNDPRDAGPIYREAIDDYLVHHDEYDDLSPAQIATAKLRGIDLILSATERSGMRLFADHPEEIVNFNPDKPALSALNKLATTALKMSLRQKTPADALRFSDAVFSLGAKLFAERVTIAEMQMGLGLMRAGARGIKDNSTKAGDTARVEATDKFLEALQTYDNQVLSPTMTVLLSIDPKIVGQHPGDLFYIARNADERVWRVGAIYALGRLRVFAGEGGMLGDQRGADKALKELSSDKDPIIATAAKAAAQMTAEQYQMQR